MARQDIDGGYAWIVLAASFGLEIIEGMFVGGVGILTTAVVQEIDSNLTRASLVSSTMLGGMTLFGPVAGLIQDRIGHRLTGIVSGVLILIGLLSASFCTTVVGLVMTLGVITGIGLGLATNLSGVAPGNYFDKKLPAAYGVCMAGGGLGLLIIGPSAVLLLEIYNLSGTLLILGGVGFHVCLAGALIRPSNPATQEMEEITSLSVNTKCEAVETGVNKCGREDMIRGNIRDPTLNNVQQEKYGKSLNLTQCPDVKKASQKSPNLVIKSFLNWFSVLKRNGFFLYAISTFFWSVGEGVCLVHLPNYIEHKGSTAGQAAEVLAVMGFACILSALLAGLTASDSSIDKLLLHTGFQGVAGTVNVLLPLYSHTFPLQIVFGSIYGLYCQAPYSLISPICIELAGLPNLAVAYGLSSFALGAGSLVGPPIASLVYEVSGIYDYTFILAGCSMIASGIFAALIPIFKMNAK